MTQEGIHRALRPEDALHAQHPDEGRQNQRQEQRPAEQALAREVEAV